MNKYNWGGSSTKMSKLNSKSIIKKIQSFKNNFLNKKYKKQIKETEYKMLTALRPHSPLQQPTLTPINSLGSTVTPVRPAHFS